MLFTDGEIAYMASQRLARLATIQPNGTLQNSPVGLHYNASLEAIDVGGHNMEASQKFRNVRANGRVALVVDDIASVQPWRVRCLEIRGHAEALTDPQEAATRLGGAIIRIHPERIISWGIDSDDVARGKRTVTRQQMHPDTRAEPDHNSYAAVAGRYAEQYVDELAHKPFDRMWLDRFIDLSRGLGRVCDVGCGPGQVARYLYDHGVGDVFGIDLSAEMLAHAARLNPDIRFERQDMLALDIPPETLGGIVAFYAIVHFSLDQVEQAFRLFERVLRPGGYVLAAFHVGDEVRHVEELLGTAVDMDFAFFQPDEVIARFHAAGLKVLETTMRYPYEGVEVATTRAYILARRPA